MRCLSGAVRQILSPFFSTKHCNLLTERCLGLHAQGPRDVRGLQALTDPYRCQSSCGQGVCREACLHSTLAPQGLAQAGSPPARGSARCLRPPPLHSGQSLTHPAPSRRHIQVSPAPPEAGSPAPGGPPVTGGRETPDRSTPSPARREEIRGSSHSAPPTARPASPDSAPT